MTFMTTNEVAALLRVSPVTLRYWRAENRGPKYFRAGRRVLYDRADVEAWIAQARSNA